MKKILSVLIFTILSASCIAQFYCDFSESKSFYNRSALLKAAGYKKEVIIIQQLKNNKLEDSFKIIVNKFNQLGNPVSKEVGSKWNNVAIEDTFQYKTAGKQSVISVTNTYKKPVKQTYSINNTRNFDESEFDTIENALFRYEYDSVKNVKKVFIKRSGREVLVELIFYDDQKRIKKIDYSPESERVSQSEYVYKKNKLKIFSVTQNDRSCNEKMEFNDAGQLAERQVDFYKNREWITNRYFFSYNTDGLVVTETKKQNRKVYTVATHYYYKD